MKLPKVSEEAEQVIQDYTVSVDEKLKELGFVLEDRCRKEFLFNVTNAGRLFSMMLAMKRGSMVVEVTNAKKAVKHASPTMLIKHALGTPEQYFQARKIQDEHFTMFKQYVEQHRKPRLLDAGCGWGRQIASYHNRGLKAEFFGVDINRQSVQYGKSVIPDAHFLVADIQYLPFRNNCFDVTICLAVVNQIKHSKGTENSIREFSSILNLKGLLELEDAFTENKLMTGALNFLARFLRVFLPEIGHFCQFNQVKKLFIESGFTNIQTEKVRPTVIPLLFGNISYFLATKT